MTTNSTYWEAKLNSDDLELAEWGKGVYKLWKNPVDLSTAFYPVEYDIVIGRNLTPDPVLSGTDTIIIFKTLHLVDREITKNVI